MSKYSKINIVSEYLTPNGYLFGGYSEKDLPEIFMQHLKRNKDFNNAIIRSNDEVIYNLNEVHSPFLDFLKNYSFKFQNIGHKKPIIEFKLTYEIKDKELNDDVLNIFLLEADHRSVYKYYGLYDMYFSDKSIDLIKHNKNCIILILDWREGAYSLPDDTIDYFNKFVETHKLSKKDVFLYNNNFQIKLDESKCKFTLGTFPYYILLGFDSKLTGTTDSNDRKLSYVTSEDSFNQYSQIRNYKFLSYNRNSDRLHRPYVISKMYNDGMLEKALVSLYESRALSNYDEVLKSLQHLEFETLKFSKEDREILKKLVDESYPLKLDYDDADECARGHNQISTKQHFLDSYINVVCETSCHSNYTFITEKTLRPIINLQPFILFGNPYSLVELRNLGFRTYDKWIDESYDTEVDTNKRFELAYNELKRLNLMDIDDIHELYYEMFDVIEYNFKHLASIFNNYELPVYLGNSIYENLK
jgi:hypothetical protein